MITASLDVFPYVKVGRFRRREGGGEMNGVGMGGRVWMWVGACVGVDGIEIKFEFVLLKRMKLNSTEAA